MIQNIEARYEVECGVFLSLAANYKNSVIGLVNDHSYSNKIKVSQLILIGLMIFFLQKNCGKWKTISELFK